MFLLDFSDPTQKWLPHNFSKKEGEDSQTLFLLEKSWLNSSKNTFSKFLLLLFLRKPSKLQFFKKKRKKVFFSFLSERKLLKTNNRLNLPFFSLSKFFFTLFVKERWIFDVSQRWNYFLASTLATNLGLLKVKNSDDWRKSIKRETRCFHSSIKFFLLVLQITNCKT